nr:MAG TPA: hypothetical protein [Bacteriophage sp.]
MHQIIIRKDNYMNTCKIYLNAIEDGSKLISREITLNTVDTTIVDKSLINAIKAYASYQFNTSNISAESIGCIAVLDGFVLHLYWDGNGDDPFNDTAIDCYNTDSVQLMSINIDGYDSRMVIVSKIFKYRDGKTIITNEDNDNAYDNSMKLFKHTIPLLRDEIIDLYNIQHNGYVDIKIKWIDIISPTDYEVHEVDKNDIEPIFWL